jgi:Ca2+-transporting ATPase
MLGGLVIGFGEALSPMQILWINLVSDVLPGLGLALQPPDPDALQRAPDADPEFVNRPEAARLARESAVMGAGALAACAWGVLRYGAQSPRTRTMTFFSLVGAELLHGFTCRSPSRGLFTREKPAPNPALLRALGASAALQAAVFCLPPLRRVMGVAKLGFADLCVTAACGLAPFLGLEAAKAARPKPV